MMLNHKKIRVLLALAVVGSAAGFVYPASAAADEPKCDCWYWQSNVYGVIVKTTVNGKEVETCNGDAACSVMND